MTDFAAITAAGNITLLRSWLATAESCDDLRAASKLLALIGRWQDVSDGVRRDAFVMSLAERLSICSAALTRCAERKERRGM